MKHINTFALTDAEIQTIRKDGIGASDSPVLCGVNPWKTPLDLWNDKTGRTDATEPNTKMQFGLLAEPILREMFEKETGISCRSDHKIRIHKYKPMIRCSLDAITKGTMQPVEFKTTSDLVMQRYEDIPLYMEYQLQHQMSVTGANRGFLAILIFGYAGIKEFVIREIKRDSGRIKEIENACFNFWNYHILCDNPPEPISLNDIRLAYEVQPGTEIEATAEIELAVRHWESQKEDLKLLKSQSDDLKFQIQNYMGNHETLKHGDEIIATFKGKKRRTLTTKERK